MRDNLGRFVKGNSGFWNGKKRTEVDKIKMSKPKSKKYNELNISDECKHCNKEYIKVIHNQLYCKMCVPDKKYLKFIKQYGIAYPEHMKMIEVSSGKCDICLNEKATDIDHCHKSGKVRGLLCHNCNMMLGHAKDNVKTLQKSIDYLKK